MKTFSWVSPSCLTFLKSRMSSRVAGIANCKVRKAGDAGSIGKQLSMISDLVQLALLCTYVLEYIPGGFDTVDFYSLNYKEQLKLDQCCGHFWYQPLIAFHCGE